MAIRQTRVFVNHSEVDDWAETLIGRVFRPLVAEFVPALPWFWFSRYMCLSGVPGEDQGDCDINGIPESHKAPFLPQTQPGHRSLRFRFDIKDTDQAAFETRLRDLLSQHGYAISDVRDYDYVGDTGSRRFLGVEHRQHSYHDGWVCHPDFRVAGKVFASLGYPDEGWGMVKLTPEQQRKFVRIAPEAFRPCNGAWRRKGCTNVYLLSAKAGELRLALEPALVKLPTTLLSGLSPRTDARRNIVEVPPVIPEIFQGGQFSVAVGKAQVDGPRQSLFDIDLSDRTVGGGGAMTGD